MTEIASGLTYYCTDLEVTRVFYGCLGLTFVKDRHGNGPEHYTHSFGGFILELYPRKKRDDDPSTCDVRQRLILQIDHFDEVLKTLKGFGLDFQMTPPKVYDEIFGLRLVFLVDPDNRGVMLMERAPPTH